MFSFYKAIKVAWLAIVILFSEGIAQAGAHEYKKTFSGDYFGCGVLFESGRLECWGDEVDQAAYIPPERVVNPDQIAIFRSTACALHDKQVTCWGHNLSFLPVGLTNVKEIVFYDHAFCAVFESGALKCWDNMGRKNILIQNMPEISPVHHIAIGDSFACATYGDDSRLACWGDEAGSHMKSIGKLAKKIQIHGSTLCIGNANQEGDKPSFQINCEVKGSDDRIDQTYSSWGSLKSFLFNSELLCAITDNDILSCKTLGGSVKVPNIKKADHLSQNRNTICIVRKDDHLRQCVGSDDSIAGTSTTIESGGKIIDLTANGSGLCYLLKDGFLNCLGLWTYMEDFVPNYFFGAQKVFARDGSVCTLSEGQEINCLGNLGKNQPELKAVSHWSEYRANICAIHSGNGVENELTCWGQNELGQASIPVTLGPVSTVTVGIGDSCASPISDESSVICWGEYPAQFNYPGKKVQEISVGLTSVCTLFTDGNVTCEKIQSYWPYPTPVSLGKVKRLVGGRLFHCAYNTENKLTCWGEIGLGPGNQDVVLPSTLTKGYPILKLSSDGDSICALTKHFIQCVGSRVSPLIYFNKP